MDTTCVVTFVVFMKSPNNGTLARDGLAVSPSLIQAAPHDVQREKLFFSSGEATTAAVHIVKGEAAALEATDEVVFMASASKLTQFSATK